MATPAPNFIWSLTPAELADNFQTDLAHGLTDDEATRRLEEEGPNELPKRPPSFWKIYLAPLFNWLIVIYLIAALVMFIFGMVTGEGNMSMVYITLGVVGINCFVAIFQQARATKKLEALRDLSAPTSTVIRGGNKVEVLTRHIVKGDLLVLDTGSKIPADARIINANNLQVNEASLTGESEPVRKKHLPLDNRPLYPQNQENILFYGTYITTGNGQAIIFATGAETEIGKISQGLEASAENEIPIRKKLNNIGKWLGLGVMAVWLVVMVILYLTTGRFEIIKSLNSAMDIMPINIPLLTTIVMLTGTLAMAEHGVIIRNLTSVDSLGRVSVVCTDKTGTLTKSQMCVQHIWARGSHFQVTGNGYTPQGEIILMDSPHHPQKVDNLADFPHLQALLANCSLNNNANLVRHEFEVGKRIMEDWKVIGNPTEGALLTLVGKIKEIIPTIPQDSIYYHCLTPKGDNQGMKLVREFPFSSQLKRMTKVYQSPEGKYLVFTKGASEILISSCSHLLAEDDDKSPLIDEIRMVLMNTINEYAAQGFRVLSFAYKIVDKMPESIKLSESASDEVDDNLRDDIESDLTYIGFVAIMDPPRDGVSEAVGKCHRAGVDVVMITGDSLPTATAIAKQIGIAAYQEQNVCEGQKVVSLAECGQIEDISVFARVSPAHKQIIVESYQNHDKVVAMTGDGVNDALALNDADVGIAMGIQGTDVAKEAADMIISDDSFLSIVEGIKRGRGIFANIRSVVFFFICINLFEGIVQFLIAIIMNRPYFLDNAFYYQWVFLSLTVHMFPGLMLTFDTISDDVMKEKPRNSQEIISKPVLGLMGIYGILLGLAMATTYFLVVLGGYTNANNAFFGSWNHLYLFTSETAQWWQGIDFTIAKTLTMLMVVLFFCETALALQIRRPNKSLWWSLREDSSRIVYWVVSLLFGIFISIEYIPGFQLWLAQIGLPFNFVPLNILDWLVCVTLAFGLCIIPFEGVKALLRKKEVFF